MVLIHWKKYKTENDIWKNTHIALSKLEGQGFTQHKIIKSSIEKKTVRNLVDEFIVGKDYDFVIYDSLRSGRVNPMFTIIIYTK